MKQLRYFLLIPFLVLACNPFQFDPPTTNSACLEFMEDVAVMANVKIRDDEAGYQLPLFVSGSNEEVTFVKTGSSSYQLLQLHLGTEQETILAESQQVIHDVDLGPNGEIVWVVDGEVQIKTESSGNFQFVPLNQVIKQAKWLDGNVLVRTQSEQLLRVSTDGQSVTNFNLPGEDRFSFEVHDSTLFVFREDWLYEISIATTQIMDSMDVSGYGPKADHTPFLSEDFPSLAITSNGKVFFSRANRLYLIDMNSDQATVIWEREGCQVLDRNISLSDDEQTLLFGAVQLLTNPHHHPDGNGTLEFGILIMDINGQNEEVLFP